MRNRSAQATATPPLASGKICLSEHMITTSVRCAKEPEPRADRVAVVENTSSGGGFVKSPKADFREAMRCPPISPTPPLFIITGFSSSGKTTICLELIPQFISQNIHNESRRDAGISRSLHTMVAEISFRLVKTIPLLSAQPFKAVNAVSAVNAPV
jgi:hypothetical protein